MSDKTDAKAEKRIPFILTWILVGVCCGVVCGGACAFFAWLTTVCDAVFHAHEKLIFLLPLTGIVVVYLFDVYRKDDDISMNALYLHMREDKPVSNWLAPMIALSTCLAYVTGGSVGRVGPSLQIGGSLAVIIGRKVSFLRKCAPPRELLMACGVAAGFCGILNAPIAGAVFGVEVLILSGKEWFYIIPTLITTSITWGIAQACHIPYVDFHGHFAGGVTSAGNLSGEDAAAGLVTTGLNIEVLLKVVVVAFAAMLAGRLFCWTRRVTVKGFNAVQNKYLRAITGTVLVIALTQILGHSDCNGIGFTYVDVALDGHSAMLAFLWKLMLTAFTLGCGIRGGEIAPVIFIGATSCYAVGCLIGLDPALAAAVGIVGALASVTNCPIAIGIYGLEAICFNGEMALYFFIAACMAHFLSGTGGLYSEQHSENQILKPRIF